MLKKFFNTSLLTCILSSTACFADQTPTEEYLTQHSLTKIQQRSSRPAEFEKSLPFFFEITEKEKEDGFFGYHASSQTFRLFQDILRVVFEEKFDIPVPKEFQFLRIPGDPLFDLKKNKESFYSLFDRKDLGISQKEMIIKELFITPFNQTFGTQASLSDFSLEEKKNMWKIVRHFTETLDLLSREEYHSFDDADHSQGSPIKAFKKTPDSNSHGFLTPEAEKQQAKKKELDELISSLHLKVEQKKKEERNQPRSLRSRFFQKEKAQNALTALFQDKVSQNTNFSRNKFTNWTKDIAKFRNFLNRVQNITYSKGFYIASYFFPYNDTFSEQQSRIVAINVPLFGNYHRSDECTTDVFVKGCSVEGGETKCVLYLKQFFKESGMSPVLADELYQIGSQELKGANHNQGCILQLFDVSGQRGKAPFAALDQAVFVSHSFGIPFRAVKPSDILFGLYPLRNNSMDLQLRLITSTYTTLNPNSSFRIKRHDTLDPKITSRILSKMREHIRNAPVDEALLEKQKERFHTLWKIAQPKAEPAKKAAPQPKPVAPQPKLAPRKKATNQPKKFVAPQPTKKAAKKPLKKKKSPQK